MEETKEIKLTGDAAESFMSGRKTRRARRGNQRGGEEDMSGMVKVNRVAAPVAAVAPVAPAAPAAPAAPLPLGEQEGGKPKKTIKVVLEKKEKPKEKVVLAPAKEKASPVKPRAKTHKAPRRIRVSLDALSNRMNRAKTIKKESQSTSIETIKKALVKAGLIKVESKAPEKILRQMYSDFEQLKQKAL
jgi:hypothetical protein